MSKADILEWATKHTKKYGAADTILSLKRDHGIYTRRKDFENANVCVEILRDHYMDWSLRIVNQTSFIVSLPDTDWDKQFAQLLSPTTPIWITE